jgi:hypothetical protein
MDSDSATVAERGGAGLLLSGGRSSARDPAAPAVPSSIPTHLGELLEGPYYGDKLDALARYMALQTRRVAWMREFPRTGEDRPVRYIRLAAPDDTPQAHSEPA